MEARVPFRTIAVLETGESFFWSSPFCRRRVFVTLRALGGPFHFLVK